MRAIQEEGDTLFDEGEPLEKVNAAQTSRFTATLLLPLQQLIGRGTRLVPNAAFYSSVYEAFVALDAKDGYPEDGRFPKGTTTVEVTVRD